MDIGTVIKRPFNDFKTMALGSLACILPGWSIGYGLKCAKDQDESLPDLSDFGETFIQGLLGFVISMIWSIPAVIIGFITMGMAIITMIGAAAKGSATGIAGALGGMGLGILVFIATLLITSYLLPLALLNFGKNGFGGAFAFGSIFKMAFTGEYFMAWLIASAVGTVFAMAGFFVSMLLSITIIGGPLAILVTMFGQTVIMFSILGEAYDKLAD